MASSYSIKLTGLSEAAQIPDWLDHAQRAMLAEVCDELAEAIGAASGSSQIRAGARGRAISSTKGVVGVYGVVFAKARDRGAYITPKRGITLRFADGTFRRVARLTPHNYVKKGMRKRRSIGEQAFARHFDNLKAGA